MDFTCFDHCLFSCILNCIYWVNNKNYFNSWGTTMIYLSLFSYWKLKMKLFKHHYISIIIIVIMGLLYNFFTERFEPENIKNNYIYYLMFSLNEILFGLTYVLYKYMMHIKFIKCYEILFYEGLIELPLSIIILIITTKIGYIDNFWDYYEQLDSNEVIIFIFITIINFIISLSMCVVDDIFSPFHVFLITILSELILAFINISESDIKISIISIILYIIILLMILIFIEIIELNFCGISEMTKRNIQLRTKTDSMATTMNLLNVDEEENEINYKGYIIELKDVSQNNDLQGRDSLYENK